MLTRAALAGLVVALALPAVPASAGICDGVTIPYCLKPFFQETGQELRQVVDDACDVAGGC